jgi:hypothetical protein
LRRHKAEAVGQGGFTPDDRPARPDAILFNGGALTPEVVRGRIVSVLSSWFEGDEGPAYRPRVLTNDSLDLAVAHGAAYYGVVRRGGGIRIGGGTARSFYVGLDASTSGRPWLCVVPRDAEEGDEIAIEQHDFDLLTDQPVSFPLASSSIRPNDKPGDLVATDPDTILDLPPLQTHIRVGRKAKAERVVVRLASKVTEVGTIEVWCLSRTDDRRWRLQIQLRGASSQRTPAIPIVDPGVATVVIEQSEVDAGVAAIKTAYSGVNLPEEDSPARLVKRLETALDAPRESWPPSALRALWEPLRDVAEARNKSPRHESRWFNLAGYFLRPGVGYPLDENRIKALWPSFHIGVKHAKDMQCWAEWWILWRRVSAGLNKAHHDEIYRRLSAYLFPPKTGAPKKATRPKPEPHEMAEIWRCAASLERLAGSVKESLGDALVKELARPQIAGHVLWCLGRVGARVPLFGPANTVVPREKAERWTQALLEKSFEPGRETADAIFALGQLARVAGDRARDLDEELRHEVIARLSTLSADESAIRPVREFTELAASQQAQALGDSLPIGLRLRTKEEPVS